MATVLDLFTDKFANFQEHISKVLVLPEKRPTPEEALKVISPLVQLIASTDSPLKQCLERQEKDVQIFKKAIQEHPSFAVAFPELDKIHQTMTDIFPDETERKAYENKTIRYCHFFYDLFNVSTL